MNRVRSVFNLFKNMIEYNGLACRIFFTIGVTTIDHNRNWGIGGTECFFRCFYMIGLIIGAIRPTTQNELAIGVSSRGHRGSSSILRNS